LGSKTPSSFIVIVDLYYILSPDSLFGHTRNAIAGREPERKVALLLFPVATDVLLLLMLLLNRNRFQLFSASACQCNDNQTKQKNKVRIINNTSPGHEICKCALHAHSTVDSYKSYFICVCPSRPSHILRLSLYIYTKES
jgi:hypothetical protein